MKRFIAWMKRPNKSAFAQWIEAVLIVLPIVFLVRTFFYGLYQVPSGSMETTMLVGEGFFADKFSYWHRAPRYGEILTFNDPEYQYSDNPMVRWFERYVWGPRNVTKRVIGLPGDTIRLTLERGRPVVYRNGKKIDEPYVNRFPLIAVAQQDGPGSVTYKSYDSTKPLNEQPYYTLMPSAVHKGAELARLYGLPVVRKPNTPAYESAPRGEIGLDVQGPIKLGPDELWVMGDNRQGSTDSRSWGPLKIDQVHGRVLWRLWSFDIPGSWLLYFFRHPVLFWQQVRWGRFFQRVQ